LRGINIPFFSPVPIVSTVHDLHVETLDNPAMEAYRREWRYRLQRQAVRRTRLVTVSSHTRDLLAVRGISGRGKVEVIPNCVGEHEYAADDKENAILFVGDAPHKNVRLTAAVFRTLADRLPDWKFIMVGAREKLSARGGVYLDQLLAEGRLRVVEDPPDMEMDVLFRKSEILFMPSLSEGFGVPALQALAKGTCAVVSDRGGLPEACGEAGVYVNPEDEAEMASTLEGLMRNPSLRNLIMKKGFAHVKKFLWKDHLARLVSVYREEAGHG
jgi:glycosyltransferase involved in cell wall biosynthesis